MDRITRLAILFLFVWTICVIILVVSLQDLSKEIQIRRNPENCPERPDLTSQTTILLPNGTLKSYDRSSPFIFIGGFPRSGTTLIRSMLDVHSSIRCGKETRVLPRILDLANRWAYSFDAKLDDMGNISREVLDDAIAAFILEIVVKHGEPAERLCNKDPFSIRFGRILLNLFPNAKFIFMIRDGRAIVHSMISRNVTITGYDLQDYQQCLTRWSEHVMILLVECLKLGDEKCLRVKYEDLVLNPKAQMERILKYLEVPWEEVVLHHEKYIGRAGGVALSKFEKSTDQVVRPVNRDSLFNWVGKIPKDLVANMSNIAPMLKILGYDPMANPPNYTYADPSASTNIFKKINGVYY